METSVSKKSLILQISGGTKIRCDLKRHLSPRTVGVMTRSLPLQGHAHTLGKSIVYFETAIDSGTERPRTEFARGDVAFLASSGSVCFFKSDATSKAMTPVGRLDGEIGALDDIKPGDVLRIYEDA